MLRNILFGLYYIAKAFVFMIIDRPKVIYFSIPKNFAAFMRMFPILDLSCLLRINVHGELAGTSFDFFSDSTPKTVRKIAFHYLRKLSSIRFLGPSIQKQHTQFGLKNPVCFSNGVSIPERSCSLPSCSSSANPLSLLYVGELSISKGVTRIVEALACCKEASMDVKCTLLGEWRNDSVKLDVQKYIADNSLSSYLEFAGLIKGDEKWDYFANAHVLVHPTDLDGQPLAILEAIGSGLAVISTHVGAIPDTVESGRNGFLMNEISTDELFRCICVFYENRDVLDKIRHHNLSVFESKYSLDAYLKNNDQWLFHEIR